MFYFIRSYQIIIYTIHTNTAITPLANQMNVKDILNKNYLLFKHFIKCLYNRCERHFYKMVLHILKVVQIFLNLSHLTSVNQVIDTIN